MSEIVPPIRFGCLDGSSKVRFAESQMSDFILTKQMALRRALCQNLQFRQMSHVSAPPAKRTCQHPVCDAAVKACCWASSSL